MEKQDEKLEKQVESQALLEWHQRQLTEFLSPTMHAVIETHIVNGKIVRFVSRESRLPPKDL